MAATAVPAWITVSSIVAVSALAAPCVVTATIAPVLPIDGVLGFVGQSGAPVLQFCDLCLIGRGVFSIHAFGFGQLFQVSRVASTRVLLHDEFHDRIGLQRGRIRADGFTFDEAALG